MPEWVQSLDIDGWTVLGVLVALVATWIIARLSRAGVAKLVDRVPGLSDGIKVLAVRLTGYGVWLIGIGVALALLGASVQPVLAVALILAVIAVLVLRGISDNFASGVVLQARHPVDVGDEITSGGVTGVVIELNSRAVVLQTADGRIVHLPNSSVLGSTLVNNSRHGSQRGEVEVRIGRSELSHDELRELVETATEGAAGVHRKERVIVRSVLRAPDRGVVLVQFWHHPLHGVAVRAAVVDALAEALADRGVPAVVTSDPPPPPLAGPTGF
ncbi:mechanosensitive ion channel family protein [Agromyces soli]